DTRPIDVAFIGSSLTMCGIHDSLLTEVVSDSLGRRKQIANLGTCFFGRDMHLMMVRRLLKHRKPSHVIVEVRTQENKGLNKSFYKLAQGSEYYSGEIVHSLTNPEVQKQTWKGARIQLRRFLADQFAIDSQRQAYDTVGYVHRFRGKQTMTPTQIPAKKAYQKVPTDLIKGTEFQLNQATGRHYLEEIRDLLHNNGVQFILLYYPTYPDHPDQQPMLLPYYESIADEVWLPPKEIFEPADHFMDPQHLNGIGGWALSQWLVNPLRHSLSTQYED
ncbi:MAG: hypothetical protein AAFR59_12485, partial [Bacteroidota bacterium]